MRQDIAIQQDDLVFKNGDFAIEQSDMLHAFYLATSFPGTFKENPLLGARIDLSLKGSASGLAKGALVKEFNKDGYRIKTLDVDAKGNWIIDLANE